MPKVNIHTKVIVYKDDSQKEFLALKATYKGEKWDLPGGNVDFPETVEVSINRELREEVSLEVENLKPRDIQSAYNKDNDEYVMFLGFEGIAKNNNIKLSSEHSEYKWVTKEEFLKMDATKYLKDFINKL